MSAQNAAWGWPASELLNRGIACLWGSVTILLVYYSSASPCSCHIRSNKTPAFQISGPHVQIWNKPETWPPASPLHQPSHLWLLVVMSYTGKAVFSSADDWSVAMGNPEQIQGPVWHLPVNIYVKSLTGVPFFINCLKKDLAVNLPFRFSYIKLPFRFKYQFFHPAFLLIFIKFRSVHAHLLSEMLHTRRPTFVPVCVLIEFSICPPQAIQWWFLVKKHSGNWFLWLLKICSNLQSDKTKDIDEFHRCWSLVRQQTNEPIIFSQSLS